MYMYIYTYTSGKQEALYFVQGISKEAISYLLLSYPIPTQCLYNLLPTQPTLHVKCQSQLDFTFFKYIVL